MNKLHGRTALLSTLPAFFSGKGRSLRALQHRRLPPLHHRTRHAAFSTFLTSSARAAATSKKPPQSAAALASQEPVTTTMSRCTPATVAGRHLFEIAGYSLVKGLGAGNFVESSTFSVGGYNWSIQFYPDGFEEYSSHDSYRHSDILDEDDEDEDEDEDDENYISVFLALKSRDAADVRAICELKLVDPATGLLPAACCSNRKPRTRTFSGEGSTWGFGKFKERRELETSSEYLRDDRLMIQCDITVVTGMPVSSQAEPLSSE